MKHFLKSICMKRQMYIIAIVCILVSCQEKKKENLHSLSINEIVYETKKEVQCYDSVEVPQVAHLFNWKITNDKIVFYMSDLNDFIAVYSYPQFGFLYKFGKMGEGAGEFISRNWGKNKELDFVTLYDIMKSSLYKYKIKNNELSLVQQYPLMKDDEGTCRPFTKIYQMNDSVFLLKEDGRDTKLHLANLKQQQGYDIYQCLLRIGKEGTYSAFDYDFDVVGNHILLVYNYIDRLEFLHVNKKNEIVPQHILGSNKDQQNSNDLELKSYFLAVTSYDNLFFCLRSNNGTEEGNVVCVFDINGNYKSQIILDHYVSSIIMDKAGMLVGYKEKDNATVFYRYVLKD